ncbi:3-isopropylmalate dehydratase large subunit [Paraburkholderia phytofirmans]|uniref:3-isopropylmalate dehydratase large subunit n=1 Tax=Paraburkholderia phytofirmans TaxID=261302 RepID=UPI0038BD88BB
MSQTLYEKIWRSHVIEQRGDGSCLLLIDRHILNEGTSPQAFAGLRSSGRQVRNPLSHLAVADHVISTAHRSAPLEGRVKLMVEGLANRCAEFGIPYIEHLAREQGICHVVVPEQGFILPGLIAVCGDSHTSTLGAFGALGFGIGTSEVEHVMATGTLVQQPSKTMRISINGALGHGVTAKDCILAVIGQIGADGATGHVIEYTGAVCREFDMEQRMTVSNMSIEAGARAGMFAPDEITFEYIKDRPLAPAAPAWEVAVAAWQGLVSDPLARFDLDIEIDGNAIEPQVTWGTSPQDVVAVTGRIPDPVEAASTERAAAMQRALEYQSLRPGQRMSEVRVDRVFIGSCTNARLSDLRAAARVFRGQRLAKGVTGLVVPGSGLVKTAAEAEGLHEVFLDAGLEWRDAGCSMCGGGADAGSGPVRVASTSNRNFENRQGRSVRTHLVSPATAAASAIAGHVADVRDFL